MEKRNVEVVKYTQNPTHLFIYLGFVAFVFFFLKVFLVVNIEPSVVAPPGGRLGYYTGPFDLSRKVSELLEHLK